MFRKQTFRHVTTRLTPSLVVVAYLLTSRLITLQRLLNLEYIVTNNGYKDIKVVTGGRANFNRDFNKIHKERSLYL